LRSTVKLQGLWRELDVVTLVRFLAREEDEAKAHSDRDQEESCFLHGFFVARLARLVGIRL
jgi:hypothetical protein